MKAGSSSCNVFVGICVGAFFVSMCLSYQRQAECVGVGVGAGAGAGVCEEGGIRDLNKWGQTGLVVCAVAVGLLLLALLLYFFGVCVGKTVLIVPLLVVYGVLMVVELVGTIYCIIYGYYGFGLIHGVIGMSCLMVAFCLTHQVMEGVRDGEEEKTCGKILSPYPMTVIPMDNSFMEIQTLTLDHRKDIRPALLRPTMI